MDAIEESKFLGKLRKNRGGGSGGVRWGSGEGGKK